MVLLQVEQFSFSVAPDLELGKQEEDPAFPLGLKRGDQGQFYFLGL